MTHNCNSKKRLEVETEYGTYKVFCKHCGYVFKEVEK